MSLFEQILGAIDNPNQQASVNQLSSLLGVAQQVTNQHGIDPGVLQQAVSLVGTQIRSSLQEKRNTQGSEQVETLVNQFSGLSADPNAPAALFSPQQQEQLISMVSEHTGIDASLLRSLLPTLVPLALNLLQSGALNQGNASGGNSVLNAFLDNDRDGDVDLGDALGMAGKFLQNQ
jgi:hypothetical protein